MGLMEWVILAVVAYAGLGVVTHIVDKVEVIMSKETSNPFPRVPLYLFPFPYLMRDIVRIKSHLPQRKAHKRRTPLDRTAELIARKLLGEKQ